VLKPLYRNYVLAVITAVYSLNLVDRMLVVLLLEPIKRDLHLSDTQLGFVTGIAFALFYSLLGIPIARWADRGNRVTITSLAIGLWALTVMACVGVTTYALLVAARVAAAVGESGCKPPTYSLIGDYFPQPGERTRAMSIYSLGSPLAIIISFFVGGWLNQVYGWRITFFLMGCPGLILAALVKLTVREPRQKTLDQTPLHRALPSTMTVLRVLWHQRSCRHLGIALILLYTVSLGLSPWYAAFMIRSHGMTTRELGMWLGLTVGVGGIAGSLLGGYAATRWFSNNERGQMRLTAVTAGFLVPCYVAFLTLPQKSQALSALIPLMIVFSIFVAPTYTLLQRLVADEMRATAMAVLLLLVNLIGMGIGPQMVGLISDLLTPLAGSDSLRYAMLVMSLVALWAAYHFWRVGQTVREDLQSIALLIRSAADAPQPSDTNPGRDNPHCLLRS
jgi:predicted MFS family arabinose efflux permease